MQYKVKKRGRRTKNDTYIGVSVKLAAFHDGVENIVQLGCVAGRDEHLRDGVGKRLDKKVIVLAQVDQLALLLALEGDATGDNTLDVLEDVLDERHQELVDNVEHTLLECRHDLVDEDNRIDQVVGAGLRNEKRDNGGKVREDGRPEAANHAVHVEQARGAHKDALGAPLDKLHAALESRDKEFDHILAGLARVLREALGEGANGTNHVAHKSGIAGIVVVVVLVELLAHNLRDAVDRVRENELMR